MGKYLFIIGFCLLPLHAHGGVYQWVDDNGHVHFGNIPPHQQNEYKVGEIELQSAPETPKKELSQEETSTVDAVPQLNQDPAKNDGKPNPDKKGEEASIPKKQSAPKHQPTKFDDRQELKKIIERLREKVQIPGSLIKAPVTDQKPLLPKTSTPGKNVQAVTKKSSKLKKSDEDNES